VRTFVDSLNAVTQHPTRRFSKVEGVGNDFILVDLRDEAPHELDRAVRRLEHNAPTWCDRRTGIGADGLLLLTQHREAHGRMIVFNADGSRPEMCGNGLRCAAAHVAGVWNTAGSGEVSKEVSIFTDAGPRTCIVSAKDEPPHVILVDVDMAGAILGAVVEARAAPGRRLQLVSMGNPHAVHFLAQGEDPEMLARSLGPKVEIDALFPSGVNVEFARYEGNDLFTVWVWERSCGITQACGTGACAVAAAAVANDHALRERPLTIRLPGGDLHVTIPKDAGEGVRMRGPARLVFEGEAPLDRRWGEV